MAILRAFKDENEEVNWVQDGTELQIQYSSSSSWTEIVEASIDTDFTPSSQSALDQEVLDRQSGDANLQTQLTSNDGDITSIQSEQTTQNTAIAANMAASALNTANISQEITDRTSADAAIQTQLDNHESDKNNPHEVTITQAISEDSNTDITTAELETLTDDSIANNLHKHSELWTPNGSIEVVRTNAAGQSFFGINDEIQILTSANSRIRINDSENANRMEMVLDNSSGRVEVDPTGSIANSSFKVRVDDLDNVTFNEDLTLHKYPSTRNDGKFPHTARSLYVDDNGKVQVGEPRSSFMTESGRIYCYTDGRWIAVNDDNYGSTYYQHNESGGTGADPVQEWEHLGTVLPEGVFLKNFYMMGRSNNTQVTDMEVMITWTVPAGTNTYASGIDNDNEDAHTTIFRDTWQNMVVNANGAAYGGNLADKHIGKAELNFLTPELGEFRIYMKPVEVATGTRYFMHSRTWEII